MEELTDEDESIEVCLRSGRSLDICNSGRSSNRGFEESLEGSGGQAMIRRPTLITVTKAWPRHGKMTCLPC